MTSLVLILLIPAAYYLGRVIQRTTDATRVMGSWRTNDRTRW
jgi:hypothetical protein